MGFLMFYPDLWLKQQLRAGTLAQANRSSSGVAEAGLPSEGLRNHPGPVESFRGAADAELIHTEVCDCQVLEKRRERSHSTLKAPGCPK